jgi:hypothetical protein
MRTIPPAETFIINKLDETQPNDNRPPTPKQVEEWMIEFAKMHVTEALKKANENTKTGVRDTCGDIQSHLVEKYILNAYSLDNVE